MEKLDRKELFDAMDARRTVAATDKIFMEFSCNGKAMGEIFETSKPISLSMKVLGTAPISRVTLVRNEKDQRGFEPTGGSKDFSPNFIDENPEAGENR